MINQAEYTKYLTDVLLALCSIPSPSGFTDAITKEVVRWLKKDNGYLEISPKNTVLCDTDTSGPVLTLAAHLDTLGAIVRSIKPKGRIRISKIGGWAENTVSGENCLVHTYSGKTFTGTFQYTNPSVHVSRSVDEKKCEDEIEVVIDQMVHTQQEVWDLGIENGNFISFEPRTILTPSGYIKSRHLDDKAGSAILCALAKWIEDNKHRVSKKVQLLFTTYEEVGHGGSAGVPLDTEEMIAIDMGAIGDDLSGSEEKVSICVKDSGGPYDYSITTKLISLAKENKLSFAADVFPYYGSDTASTLRAGYAIKHGLIGPGVYASHGYERTHIQGLYQTLLLLIHYITQ